MQNDEVAMKLLLDTNLARIITIELKTKIVPSLSNHIPKWKKFIENTVVYVKTLKLKKKKKKLSYLQNIKFTYEHEK